MALASERYRAQSWQASVEDRYGWKVHEDETKSFYIEPTAQVIVTDYSSDAHREADDTVVESQGPGVTSRLGVRMYSGLGAAGGKQVQPFAANWWWPRSFCVATVLDLDSASALLVATFLSASARSARAAPLAPATWSQAASVPSPRHTSEQARRRDARGAACHALQ